MVKKSENYYDKIVKLYDLMYNKKTGFDHKAQVKWIDNWRKKLQLTRKTLDLACGTGKHLHFFSIFGYECLGIDASSEMIKFAKKENKNMRFQKGYFHSFKLRERWPVITSFFNAMNYNTNDKEMVSSLKNIKGHLENNGIFVFDIVCKSNPKKAFQVKTFNEEGINFSKTFAGVPTPKGYKSTMYYVVFDGRKSEVIEETTLRGAFSVLKVRSLLKKTGFKVLYTGEGYSDGGVVFVAQNQI